MQHQSQVLLSNGSGASNDTLVAGFSLTFSNYMASSELVAKANVATAQNDHTPVVTEGDAAQQDTAEEAQPAKNPFANVAIAQVDNYVNIRKAKQPEDSEVLGKHYHHSAATVQTDRRWLVSDYMPVPLPVTLRVNM